MSNFMTKLTLPPWSIALYFFINKKMNCVSQRSNSRAENLHLRLGLLYEHFKLLGTGTAEVPVVNKTKFFSKLSEKKIKATGGAHDLAS